MKEKRKLSDEDIDLIKAMASTRTPCNSCPKKHNTFLCFCSKYDEYLAIKDKQLMEAEARDLCPYISHYKEFLQISEKILKLKNREIALKKELTELGIIPIPTWDENDKR